MRKVMYVENHSGIFKGFIWIYHLNKSIRAMVIKSDAISDLRAYANRNNNRIVRLDLIA